MAPHLDDIFDTALLGEHVKNKLVKLRSHPTNKDIVVANYTPAVSYGSLWDEVTVACRGLIFNRSTGEVLARPWAKFFNHNQPEAPTLGSFGNVEVTDKMDGSLIIGWRDSDGSLKTATKGSFESEMAGVAADLLEDRHLELDPLWTPLFEVIYPGNRVVIDYKGARDLFLLGAVHMVTGEAVGPHAEVFQAWDGSRTEVFNLTSMDDAIRMAPRDNAEGIIVRDVKSGQMVKIKQDDYIDLHRKVTNMSTLHVWESLAAGEIEALIEAAPDELYDSLKSHVDALTARHDELRDKVCGLRDEIVASLGVSLADVTSGKLRKEFALKAKELKKTDSRLVFPATFSPDRFDDLLWESVRPSVEEREYLGFGSLRNK